MSPIARYERDFLVGEVCEKPCVPKKMIGTLTLSILKFAYTLVSPMIFYKLYSVATPKHPKPLPLENHVRIVALTPESPFIA
jgi:hypothetical protein